MALGFLPPKQQPGSSLGFLPPKQPGNIQVVTPSAPQSGFDKFGNNLKYAGKQNAPVWDTMGALNTAARGIQEAGAGGLKTFSEGIGNTAKAVTQGLSAYSDATSGRTFAPQQYKDAVNAPLNFVGDAAQNTGKWLGSNVENVQKKMGLNTNSGAAQVGGFLGNLAAQVPSMVLGSKATDAIKGANPGFIRGLMGDVGGGAIATQGMTAANEGRFADSNELASGGAIDVASNVLGGGLNKLARNAYNKVLGLSRGEAGKLAEKGVDAAKALAEKGYVSASKEGLAKKVGKDVKKMAENLDNLIKKTTGKKVTAADLVEGVRTKVLQSPKLKPKFGEMASVEKQIKTALDEFEKTVGNRTKILNLEEVQNLKKKLGNSLSGMLSRSGDAKGTAKELVNDVIRDNSKNVIETNVKGAKEINKKMAPLIEAKKVLKKKGDYSGYLTDTLLGSAIGGGSLASGKDPNEALWDAAKTIAAKRFIQAPIGRTLRGSVLGKASKIVSSPVTQQFLKNMIIPRIKQLK